MMEADPVFSWTLCSRSVTWAAFSWTSASTALKTRKASRMTWLDVCWTLRRSWHTAVCYWLHYREVPDHRDEVSLSPHRCPWNIKNLLLPRRNQLHRIYLDDIWDTSMTIGPNWNYLELIKDAIMVKLGIQVKVSARLMTTLEFFWDVILFVSYHEIPLHVLQGPSSIRQFCSGLCTLERLLHFLRAFHGSHELTKALKLN